MRLLPLLPSSADPAPWSNLREAELAWDGRLHGGWAAFARTGGVHAIHLGASVSLEEAAEALRQTLPLGPDFLVLPAGKPEGRKAAFAFLGLVEALLEALAPKGLKLAIKPGPGAETELARLLKEARGEAVGFCWHGGVRDLAAIEDRLFCATGSAEDDLDPLRRLGYRWNLAVDATGPAAFEAAKTAIEGRFPAVLFPQALPTHVMGRPVVPDPGVRFARPEDRGVES
ncbi:MAG TPA: hypothetical protein VFF77_07060 [Holophagaceae bacterium]|jgi:hypothetical protein|nr:hypothetical protein [Holophagaceae bacterium]